MTNSVSPSLNKSPKAINPSAVASLIFTSLRPHFFFLSGTAGLAGIMLGYNEAPLWKAIVSFIVLFFSYGSAQMLDDLFDLEADKINAPERPLASGELPLKTGIIVVGALMAIIFAALFVVNWLCCVVAAVGGIVSFTYSKFKGIPHLGHIWSGILMGFTTLLGAVSVSEYTSLSQLLDFPPKVWLGVAIAIITFSGFTLVSYFKDVIGDHQAGYFTLPVKIGPERAAYHTLVYPALALIVGLLLTKPLFLKLFPTHTTLDTSFIFFYLLGIVMFIKSCHTVISIPVEDGPYDALVWACRSSAMIYLSLAIGESGTLGVLALLLCFSIMEWFIRHTEGLRQL